MRILAIETSCDETSIAILETDKNGSFKLLSNIVSSQVKIHAPFGGVVPMLAKREHQKNLVPILKQALKESDILISQVTRTCEITTLNSVLKREPVLLKKLLPFLKKYVKPNIDLIAVTNGPGLEPALWVGVNFAKALGYFWNLPVMPINHVEGHIIANWLPKIPPNLPLKREESPSFLKEGWGGFNSSRQSLVASRFPALVLVVSGGHTQLILMRDFGEYKILGETRDDAAGEAFDKLAKMLNLGYPGGPIVAQLAKSIDFANQYDLRNRKVKLPRPMINSGDYDFSFSGLKTAALYFVKTLDKKTLKHLTPAICAEFQQAAIDVLVLKTLRAAKEFGAKTVLLSGGVASNDLLRDSLSLATERLSLNFSAPPKNFCTDNAAMIALTAAIRVNNYDLRFKNKSSWQKIQVDANLRLA